MKPSKVKHMYFKENKKDPKFEVSDYVRISKYKNDFAKGYEELV